jgi:hypothetical protein
MIRDHVIGFAAIVAAILSIGGALAICQAQDNVPTPAKVVQKAQVNSRPAAGFGGLPAGGRSPMGGSMSGMKSSDMMRSSMMMMMGTAVDEDPEMNELAQAEAALADESAEIVSRFAETENTAERKQIMAELRETLAKQFDVQKKRREIELGRIEERVRKLRDQIKKRDDARETIIDRRLDQLVNDADGLGWSPPVKTKNSRAVGSSSGSSSSGNKPAAAR